MFFELAQLSIRNLLRARLRLLMTAGGVVVGTTAVILLIGLTVGLQTAAEAGIGNDASLTEISVWPNYGYGPDGPEGGENIPQLDIESVQAMWQIKGVKAVISVINLRGGEVYAGDYVGYIQVIGIDPRLLPYLDLQIEQGQLSLQRGEMLIGPHVGDYFNDPNYEGEEWQPVQVDLYSTPAELKLIQYTGTQPKEREIPLNVAGQFGEDMPMFNYAALMHIQDVIDYNSWIMDEEFDPETFIYDQVTVYAKNREVTNEVSNDIRDLGFMTGGMGDYLNELNNFFGTMRLMLGGIGGVALLVAAFGVANTMMMSILERTKEIGLMKSIGATDSNILNIFLIEAGLVGLSGGLAGIGLSLFLKNMINQSVEDLPAEEGVQFLPINIEQVGGNLIIIPDELLLFAVLLATLVGLAAGFLPAWRAAHMPPVQALKQE